MEIKGLGLKGRSYKVMVRVNDEDGWTSNLLRFATRDAARVYGRGLAARWGQVEGWRVDPSDDDVSQCRCGEARDTSLPAVVSCRGCFDSGAYMHWTPDVIENAGLDLENGQ